MALMQEDRMMTSEEVAKFGLTIKPYKAVARLTNKPSNNNNNKMSEKKDEKGLLAKIKALFEGEAPKNLIVIASNQDDIDFYELEDDATPKKGDKARINDKDANGDVLLQDGSTYVFVDGVLDEIKPKETDEPDAEDSQEVVDLKAQVLELTSQLSNKVTIETELSNTKAELKASTDKLTGLKNIISTYTVDTKSKKIKAEPSKVKNSMVDAINEIKNKK